MPFATILSPFLHTKLPLVQLYSLLVFNWFSLVNTYSILHPVFD